MASLLLTIPDLVALDLPAIVTAAGYSALTALSARKGAAVMSAVGSRGPVARVVGSGGRDQVRGPGDHGAVTQ